jgi:hypothetical protein
MRNWMYEHSIATARTTPNAVHILAASWSENPGVATVRIDAKRLDPVDFAEL